MLPVKVKLRQKFAIIKFCCNIESLCYRRMTHQAPKGSY